MANLEHCAFDFDFESEQITHPVHLSIRLSGTAWSLYEAFISISKPPTILFIKSMVTATWLQIHPDSTFRILILSDSGQ